VEIRKKAVEVFVFFVIMNCELILVYIYCFVIPCLFTGNLVRMAGLNVIDLCPSCRDLLYVPLETWPCRHPICSTCVG